MSSRTAEGSTGTAAWRISLWSAIAFAVGTAIAFWLLQSFLARDIQSRADSWLSGELGVLADVAERTPENRLHDAVVREVAELASREAPHDDASAGAMDRAVFFLQTGPNGQLRLHTGAGAGAVDATAIRASRVQPGTAADVFIPGFAVPFRVAEGHLADGDLIYLALSTSYEIKVLHRLHLECVALWCAIIALGTLIVFISTRRMLHRVQVITETAASIGQDNLSSRVPVVYRDDEISRLSSTLNKMLDRIQASVEQLHAMSDSLAHDLRSPMTAVRGRLELALMNEGAEAKEDAIVHCIEELDRLSSLLSTSLDLSEASADALRLRKESIDLDQTVRSMVELYEPSFAHSGLNLVLRALNPVCIDADPALLQRMLANLLDNELRHLRPGSTVTLRLQEHEGHCHLVIEDDGSGFPEDLLSHVFERYTKGPLSKGYGLGLAFVAAVARSHDGSVTALNRTEGGARITVEFPKSLVSSGPVLTKLTAS